MNIAYHGSFLRQGLEQLGHNILSIPADDIDINLRLKNLGQPVDLVIIEPYGSSFSVRELADCEHEIENHDARAADAMVELGNIYARRGKHGPPAKYYPDDATAGNSVAWAKLACLYAAREETGLASVSARRFLQSAGLEQSVNKSMGDIFLDLATGHAARGRKFDLGFNKHRQDMFPGTAFEAAHISWQS